MKGNIAQFLRKNLLPIAFLVLILGYVGVTAYKDHSNKAQKTLTVTIKEDGFHPSKVVIEEGDTVTWVNEGEKPHWPASNFHPNHTLYPDKGGCLGSTLDACKGLAKGETFSFKFNRTGIWPLHDHLYPGLVMTVEVTEQGKNAATKFSYNKNTTPEEFRSFNYADQLEFMRIKSEKNPKDSWEFLKNAFIVNGQVVGNAHELAHIVGNASYKKSGLNGIQICDAHYAFGCFHGVTEAMLLAEGTNKVKDIEQGCLKLFPPEKSQDYTGCIHGTGHGVYTWEGGNLKQSLADCDVITKGYRQYCYDGVFMENASAVGVQNLDEKNPWELCSALGEEYHLNCARYQSTIFLSKFQKSDVVGKLCELGPSKVLKETCYESLGYYIAQIKVGEPISIAAECRLMPTMDGRVICTKGGAVEIIFQQYGDYKASSKQLCETLPAEKRQPCTEGVEWIIESYAR